jgi:hypothetical protein
MYIYTQLSDSRDLKDSMTRANVVDSCLQNIKTIVILSSHHLIHFGVVAISDDLPYLSYPHNYLEPTGDLPHLDMNSQQRGTPYGVFRR